MRWTVKLCEQTINDSEHGCLFSIRFPGRVSLHTNSGSGFTTTPLTTGLDAVSTPGERQRRRSNAESAHLEATGLFLWQSPGRHQWLVGYFASYSKVLNVWGHSACMNYAGAKAAFSGRIRRSLPRLTEGNLLDIISHEEIFLAGVWAPQFPRSHGYNVGLC